MVGRSMRGMFGKRSILTDAFVMMIDGSMFDRPRRFQHLQATFSPMAHVAAIAERQ